VSFQVNTSEESECSIYFLCPIRAQLEKEFQEKLDRLTKRNRVYIEIPAPSNKTIRGMLDKYLDLKEENKALKNEMHKWKKLALESQKAMNRLLNYGKL
jgi:hypothetical protein